MPRRKKRYTGSHAKRRFKERFGVSLTKRLRQRIISRIRKDEAMFLARKDGRVRIWLVEIDEMLIKVVMDMGNNQIITCMTPTDKEETQFYLSDP